MASADRLIEVFNEAKARPVGAERDHFLSKACRDDLALKDQVLSLLQAHEAAGNFLKHTLFVPPVSPLTEKPGDRIGRYKLLEQIGEGGCGVVYMAEQEEPVRRRVALKVIKLGMDTKQVIARFEAERQALAMMDHPNIAKVLDAGATDAGRPFFVMELVRGIKITDYCDQNNLSTEERLKLFTQVCQAIQHAHQKGVIHRDIKPSNILVTHHDDLAVPKVIDFGIAKATIGQLTDKTVFTAFAQFMGTPAYMSPEQAQMSGLDIDTRADIYSLGVLLYELLTGNTPFDAKALLAAGMDEMRRKIREDEPAKPSTCLSTMTAMDLTTVARHRHVEPPRLLHLIRGDLDWLVMKCLEKDRTRRYETASGLVMDIQRHLNNEPVTACPPSRLYEFQKTVQRHKFGFTAAAALIFVLGMGVLGSTWQALRATRAEHEQSRLRRQAEANEKRAESEAAKSQQVAQFMKDMLKGVGPGVARGRDTVLLREILDQTTQRLSKDLARQPEVEADLRYTLGYVYRDLGDYTNAAAMHREALAIRREVHGHDHPDVASSLVGLGEVLHRQGKNEAAEKAYREALEIQKRVSGTEGNDVATTLDHLASLLRKRGRPTNAEPLVREALAIRRKLFGNEHAEVAAALNTLGLVLQIQPGKLVEAEQAFREALAMRKTLPGDDSLFTAETLGDLGRTLEKQGRLAEAEALCREALTLQKKLLGNDHPDLVDWLGRLVSVLRRQGKNKEAETVHREMLALQTKLLGGEHREVATSLLDLAELLRSQRKWAEAEVVLHDLLAGQRRLLGDEHRDVASVLIALARVLDDQGKTSEAEILDREALAIGSKLLSPGDKSVVISLDHLASMLQKQGKTQEAEKHFEDIIGLAQKTLGESDPILGRMLNSFAEFLLFQENKPGAAIEQYLKALPIRRARQDEALAWTLSNLGYALRLAGRAKDAEPYLRESVAVSRKLGRYPDYGAWRVGQLAGVLSDQGKLAEAEAVWREELAMEKKLLGDEHPLVANALHTFGDMLRDSGQWTESEAAFREAVAMRRKLFGKEHLDLAHSLHGLAWMLNHNGKRDEAEALSREALAMRRKLLGNEHPDVAATLQDLASFLRAQGKLSEAETGFREVITIRQKQLGNENPELRHLFHSLTEVLCDGGKLDEAEAAVREELALSRRLGNGHPHVVHALQHLADVLGREGKYAEVKTLYHEAAEHADAGALNEMAWELATASDPKLRDGPGAVTFAEKAVAATNRKDPVLLDTLAAAYAEIGQFTNAVGVQQEAIALLPNKEEKKDYATRVRLYIAGLPYRDHAALARTVRALLAQGKFVEAEPLARECLALRETQIPGDWLAFNSRSVLGGSLLGQKKFTEAETLLLSGYAGMKQREGKIPENGKIRLQESLQRLVQLYEGTGQSEKAAEWNKKLAEFDKKAK